MTARLLETLDQRVHRASEIRRNRNPDLVRSTLARHREQDQQQIQPRPPHR